MTTITPTSGLQALAQSQGAAAGSKIGADFNMFLKLLTSQMQNQDPLDPMKTNEYTQQLVQYSQVEQSLQQTSTLKEILSRLNSQTMAQAASYIGLEGQFDGAIAGLDSGGGSAAWSYAAERSVASMVATITDATGRTVRTMNLSSVNGTGRLVWDGQTVGGVRAPEGPYSLSITALDATGNAVPVRVNALGTVRTVASENNQVMLGTGGVSLPISSLIAVSAAAQPDKSLAPKE